MKAKGVKRVVNKMAVVSGRMVPIYISMAYISGNVRWSLIDDREIDIANRGLENENREIEIENREIEIENRDIEIGNREIEIENRGLAIGIEDSTFDVFGAPYGTGLLRCAV